MLQKSKLFSAKLKITELKEKYSKQPSFLKIENVISDQLHVSNEDLTEIPSVKSQQFYSFDKRDDLQPITFNSGELFNNDSSQQMTKTNPGTSLHEINQSLSSISVASDQLEKISSSYSSHSHILSDLSNQFENICFISSSSDDKNVLNLTDDFKSNGIINTGKIHETNEKSSNSTKNINRAYQGPEFKKEIELSVNSNISDDSQIQSPLSYDTSSVLEYLNETDYTKQDISAHENTSESKGLKKKINIDIELADKESSESKQISLPPKYVSSSESKVKTVLVTKDNKLKKENDKVLATKDINEETEIVNKGHHSLSERGNFQPKLLKSSESIGLVDNISIANENELKREIIKTPLSKDLKNCNKNYDNSKLVRNKYILRTGNAVKNKKKYTTSDVYSNESYRNPPSFKNVESKKSCLYKNKFARGNSFVRPISARPVLTSCKLIRYSEADFKELEEKLMKNPQISLQAKLQENLYFENNSEASCDEVINTLLKNQINFTRYFIESHHEMYLQCCLAAKMLSERYWNSQQQPKDIY